MADKKDGLNVREALGMVRNALTEDWFKKLNDGGLGCCDRRELNDDYLFDLEKLRAWIKEERFLVPRETAMLAWKMKHEGTPRAGKPLPSEEKQRLAEELQRLNVRKQELEVELAIHGLFH